MVEEAKTKFFTPNKIPHPQLSLYGVWQIPLPSVKILGGNLSVSKQNRPPQSCLFGFLEKLFQIRFFYENHHKTDSTARTRPL